MLQALSACLKEESPPVFQRQDKEKEKQIVDEKQQSASGLERL